MARQTDLMVVLEDRPGIAARVGRALGQAGVNIDGACGFTSGGLGILHVLLAEDAVDRARAALDDAGVEIMTQQHVAVVPCPDEPGALGRAMQALSAADINCELLYLTTSGRLVIGAEELERVVAVLA